MGEMKVVGIFCEKCGQDFTKAVALFGKEVMGWHMAIHERDELVKENSDLKERIGELEEELANIFTEGSLLCRWLFNPDNFFSAMASWLRSKT